MIAHLPALQIVLPLIAAPLCLLLRRGALAWALSLIVSLAALVIAAMLLAQVVDSGPISYELGGWEPPWGIEYRVDVLNAFVLLIVAAILLDLGIPAEKTGAMAWVATQSCFIANAVEGAEQSPDVLRKLPVEALEYVGPAPRRSLRAIRAPVETVERGDAVTGLQRGGMVFAQGAASPEQPCLVQALQSTARETRVHVVLAEHLTPLREREHVERLRLLPALTAVPGAEDRTGPTPDEDDVRIGRVDGD